MSAAGAAAMGRGRGRGVAGWCRKTTPAGCGTPGMNNAKEAGGHANASAKVPTAKITKTITTSSTFSCPPSSLPASFTVSRPGEKCKTLLAWQLKCQLSMNCPSPLSHPRLKSSNQIVSALLHLNRAPVAGKVGTNWTELLLLAAASLFYFFPFI